MSVSVLSFFFFFQAEDGIRDGHVTGVQTCALPIFSGLELASSRCLGLLDTSNRGRHRNDRTLPNQRLRKHPRHRASRQRDVRSEERRVGKECRCRWGRERQKKKEREREESSTENRE